MTGKQVMALRKRLGMTRDEFAVLIGVDRSTVWRWESGASKIDKFKAGALLRLETEEAKT